MRVETVVKEQLAAELIGMFEDWTQVHISAALHLPQGDVSLLRRGRLSGFSVARLLRCFAWRGYNVEVRLVEATNRRTSWPTVTVTRFDRFGREVGRHEELAR